MSVLPPEVSPGFAALLVAASFFTSALTAGFGIGGGLALLAIMATGLPTTSLIPVHGVVQLGSNVGRAIVQRSHVDWPVAAWFCGGSVLGSLIGGPVVTTLPDGPMKLALSGFILLMVWGPKPESSGGPLWSLAVGGAVGGALTMAFGATGPFTAAALTAKGLAKMPQVATFAVCMSVQHVAKALIFGALGFAFAPWAVLIAAMIATGFLGTLAGGAVLKRLPEARFKTALSWLLTLLALHLAWAGLRALSA